MRLNNYLKEKKIAIEVYDNPRGEEARVRKLLKGFNIQVDNKYVVFIPNKKKFKEWQKKERWDFVGTDLVYENVSRGRTTENEGHSHNYRVDAIGSGFTTLDNTKHIHAIGVWKVKTAHGHEHEIKTLPT